MKKMKAICKKCGEVEISGIFSDSGEEAMIIPVGLASTIPALGRVYKRHIGTTFSKNDDGKISERFEKKWMKLSHKDMFEDDWEEHMMKPIECWCLII